MSEFELAIEACLKKEMQISSKERVVNIQTARGGTINDAYIATTSNGSKYFVKRHSQSASFDKRACLHMFQTEADGLRELRKANVIRVPKPICVGELSNGAFIIIEAIKMHPLHNEVLFAEQLAAMHSIRGPKKFGLDKDNFIGSIPQPNGWHENWVDLLRMRLEFQFKLAQFPEEIDKQARKLLDRLPEFFQGIKVVPSLVHGDIWSGNCMVDENRNPVIFDPAAYWGHHEAELGMMRIFGGYSAEFYKAYHSRIPKAPGFEKRAMVYELYHIVNHYNIFGGGYMDDTQSLLERILRS
ncbi:hypothetical protein GGI23_002896 [Coemansia sp. RSA 2559]|nr:hypothetical protein GGI23_002896 [Coemansia sp. RSA 2559]